MITNGLRLELMPRQPVSNDKSKCAGKRSSRSHSGLGALEVAITSFLMIVVSVLALDIGLMNFAFAINDAACRDAARQAAQCTNATTAILAAQTQLKMHSTDGVFLSQPAMVGTTSPNFVYQDYAGNPPANTSAYVTVTTVVNIRMPFPIVFYGASFYTGGNTVAAVRRYTFPIIKRTFYG
jgi:hypothetical protein